MKVKMILPALTEAISPYFRPIKYSLFPPLGLATLAGYLDESDQVTLQDEHVLSDLVMISGLLFWPIIEQVILEEFIHLKFARYSVFPKSDAN